jgi:hypothetical protein
MPLWRHECVGQLAFPGPLLPDQLGVRRYLQAEFAIDLRGGWQSENTL